MQTQQIKPWKDPSYLNTHKHKDLQGLITSLAFLMNRNSLLDLVSDDAKYEMLTSLLSAARFRIKDG